MHKEGLFLGYNAKPWYGKEQISTTKKYPLGCYFDDAFGRRFRYGLNGSGALVAGDLVQSAALGGAGTTLQTVGIIGAVSIPSDKRIYVAALTTAQADQLFVDGWAGFEDTSLTASYLRRIIGQGPVGTVMEHTTWVDAYIDIDEPLPVALTLTDTVALMVNPYSGIIQMVNAAATGMVLGGVSCAVAASNYCWIQTRGPFACHIKDGALVAGAVVQAATTVGTPTAITELIFGQQIGIAYAAWADEATGIIFLTCE